MLSARFVGTQLYDVVYIYTCSTYIYIYIYIVCRCVCSHVPVFSLLHIILSHLTLLVFAFRRFQPSNTLLGPTQAPLPVSENFMSCDSWVMGSPLKNAKRIFSASKQFNKQSKTKTRKPRHHCIRCARQSLLGCNHPSPFLFPNVWRPGSGS